MMRSIRRWGTLGVASVIALIGASCSRGCHWQWNDGTGRGRPGDG